MKVHITVTDDNGNTYEGAAELTMGTAKATTKTKKTQKANKSTIVKGPAGAIKKLYNEHFFKTPKTISQLMKKLSDEGINFSIQLISMALYRAKYLTKQGKPGSYAYVQKSPPS
jgi:hypothetical protein